MRQTLALGFPALLALSAFAAVAGPAAEGASGAAASDNPEVAASRIIYVPTRHGKLARREVRGTQPRFMPSVLSTYALVVADRALPQLFKKAPSSFPKGTRLTQFPSDGGDGKSGMVMEVSLSRQFLQPGFWNSRQKTFLAVYAIVNTASQGSRVQPDWAAPLRVRILVNSKRVRNLAHMDLRQPLRPRRDIIAWRNKRK
jgi:hypothetical protein